MDSATVIGIIAAFSLMGFAIVEGGSIQSFLNLPAILIVMGGTLGACLIYHPMHKVLGIFSILRKALSAHTESYSERVGELARMAEVARREGLLAVGARVDALPDSFFRRSMQMAIDGTDPAEIAGVMGREIAATGERHRLGADIFSTMGTFAPAMGMIGTLIGLVNMLQGLDNPANIGPAMAVALLSTLYGALLANLVFFPLSGKLRYKSWREITLREMTLEGVLAISEGDHPTILEQKLLAFIHPQEEPGSGRAASDPAATTGRRRRRRSRAKAG